MPDRPSPLCPTPSHSSGTGSTRDAATRGAATSRPRPTSRTRHVRRDGPSRRTRGHGGAAIPGRAGDPRRESQPVLPPFRPPADQPPPFPPAAPPAVAGNSKPQRPVTHRCPSRRQSATARKPSHSEGHGDRSARRYRYGCSSRIQSPHDTTSPAPPHAVAVAAMIAPPDRLR